MRAISFLDLLRVGISAIRRRSNTFLLSFSEPTTPDKGSQAVELDSLEDFSVTSRLDASQPVLSGPGSSLPNATTSTDREENNILIRDSLRNGSETPPIGSSLKNPSSGSTIKVLNASLATQQSPENSRSTVITELSTEEYGTHGFLTCGTSPNSSTSTTSATDDSGPRTRAKKPRPSDSTESCVGNLDHTRSGSERCWAHLSYWEGDRHVAQSWYKLTDCVVYVVYDDDPSKSQFTSRLHDRIGTRRSRGVTCIRLSTLVHRPKTPSPFTPSTDSSALPPCVTCNRIALSKPCPDPVSSLGRGERLYRNICYPRFSERSSSWRQCYRLGNQGLVLTLTPQGRVWLANQTQSSENLPIFVSSSCLSSDAKRGAGAPWVVRRVPSGYSIVVFDLVLFRNHVAQSSRDTIVHFPNGLGKATIQQLNPPVPVVHISLGKGWGPSYRRPDFTHCPARLELWINVEQLSVVF
ncbi:MH2 domain protein [Opisthorchis viverrini]|uniref:MH2 domain protein n=1 Tax=Opisthorchis viverrini TaxID=6198 RepID=A0A1S8WHX0_OPIVI|nr:MH2 domain protein [Opisthorchis viverrini]